MHSKEFLKNKSPKELAQIQNGKFYEVSSAHGKPKPMSATRTKLEAIKKEKASATKRKENEKVLHKCSDSVLELLHTLSKPAKAPVRKPAPAKDETQSLLKKLIGVLQATQANNNPKAKTKVQEWNTDSDDEEESDESEEE